MAKQTFTTGQVLTAAQMTSLQQTAMLGGAASAKTASYTLVAADAGTAISMDSASATTITVNTALFAAGDTVQVTNLGAGVCTITAGTATVNTSASLALAQYESGTLDFTSTSAAIFFKGAGAAASSGSMTLLNSGGTTLTGASVTISSIDQTYQNLYIVVRNFLPATDTRILNIRLNGATSGFADLGSSAVDDFDPGADSILLGAAADNAVATFSTTVATIYDYANTSTGKLVSGLSVNHNPTTSANFNFVIRNGFSESTSAITSIVFRSTLGNLTSGTLFLYGVK